MLSFLFGDVSLTIYRNHRNKHLASWLKMQSETSPVKPLLKHVFSKTHVTSMCTSTSLYKTCLHTIRHIENIRHFCRSQLWDMKCLLTRLSLKDCLMLIRRIWIDLSVLVRVFSQYIFTVKTCLFARKTISPRHHFNSVGLYILPWSWWW